MDQLPPRCLDTVLDPDLRPMDVAASPSLTARGWPVAWSESTLEQEQVVLGWLSVEGKLVIHNREPGFQPALPAGAAHAWGREADRFPAAFLTRGARGICPAVVLGTGAEVHLPARGLSHNVSCALSRDRDRELLWVAWTERIGQESFVRVLTLDESGHQQEVCCLPGSACSLAGHGGSVRLAWVQEDELWVGQWEGASKMGQEVRVTGDPGMEAPRLAVSEKGRWAVAWQAPLADGVLSHLKVALETGQGFVHVGPPVHPDQLHLRRDRAGEDQGWEVPDLLFDRQGTLWVAGRSSGGFHVQALTDQTWTRRQAVFWPGWGGRSRTCCLLRGEGAVLLLRGTPGGLALGCLPSLPPARAPGSSGDNDRERERAAGVVLHRPRGPAGKEPGWPWPLPLFGDLHQHSILSDGLGSAERAYVRAREIRGHDFAALTDHEMFCGRSLGPLTWRYLCDLADAFYEPGRFVTLYAYEFSGRRLPGPGHKCVYFGGQAPEIIPRRDVKVLMEVLRDHEGIAVPHHVGWTGADLEHHDEVLQPVWEICSVHGAYEHRGNSPVCHRSDVVLDGQFIQQALAAGLRMGFVGGTDSHGLRWHHGVAHRPDPWQCGLAAVYAGEATRAGLMEALRARRCYATSGARILLWVEVEGAPMGSVVQAGRPMVFVAARGTETISRLSVILDGREVHVAGGKVALSFTFECERPDARATSHLYVRVTQKDGQMAWSSPVWLDWP